VSRDFLGEISKGKVSEKSFFSRPGEGKNCAAHAKMKFKSLQTVNGIGINFAQTS
jgi:hypothetical protein